VGYYRAGDYYRGGGYYRAGGILGTIGKAIGGVAKAAFNATPIGSAVSTISGLLSPTSRAPAVSVATRTLVGTPVTLSQGPGRGVPEPGITGVVHRMVPGGSSGRGYYNKKGEWKEGKRPTMNVSNSSAARRAVRRIKGARHLLQSIEREMPHKHCTRPHKAR